MLRFRSAGYTLVEVLVGMGLLAVSVVAIGTVMFRTIKNISELEIVTTANMLRMSLVAHLQNDPAWKLTVNDLGNTNLTCLRSASPCAVTDRGAFQLHDSSGAIYYDSRNAAAGFTEQGIVCSTFDSINGNDDCPFRLDLTWEPECSAPCTPSLAKVTASITFFPSRAKRIPFSTQNYSAVVIRKAVVP